MAEKKKCTATRDLYGYWQRVTTRWQDNDIYGHINNAIYYAYIDSVINGYMIEQGILNPQKGEIIGLVVESHCQFCRSLSYPALIDGGLRIKKIGVSSVRYEVGMFPIDNDQPAAVGGYTHVFVDRLTRQPAPITPVLREAFEDLIDLVAVQS